MEDDTDVPQERETKDFQFRQLKKTRIFPSPPDLPKERSNLLAVSNKFGFVFAGGSTGINIYRTDDVLIPIKPGEDPNDIVAAPPGIVVPTMHPVHHVALSSDDLTLSVCTSSSDRGAHVFFYDVRTLVGESKQPKEAFTSQPLSRDAGSFITDLKWNPVMFNLVAVCLSDGSISVYEVTNHVRLYANLPATLGVTCVCWSPKGKQLAVGKQNGTVVQYVPTLEERKVIPCPSFYESDPVKVLDILWISTYVFAVVYAAADGSLETSPQLVMVLLPKKEDKRGERLLNFTETCYSSSSERQHHFFMNYIDDWEILLGASAASIEVSVIARPPDQSLWELWLLEDSSRAELPVTDNSEDTLPMGVVVSYTSQLNVFISEEKILPPSPVLLLLSTDGVLCPFHMVNETPGAKSVTVKPERVPMEGERPITAAGIAHSFTAPGPAAAVASPPQPGAFIGNVTNTPLVGFLGKPTAPALGLPTKPQAPVFGMPAAMTSAKPQSTAAPVFGLSAASGPAKPQPAGAPVFGLPTASAKPQSAAPLAFSLPAASGSPKPQPTTAAVFGLPATNTSAKPQPTAPPVFGLPTANIAAKPQASAAPVFGLPAANVSAKPQTTAPAFADASVKPPAAASSFSFTAASLSGKPQPSPAFSLSSTGAATNPQAPSFGFGATASSFSFNPQDNSSFAGKPQPSPAFSVPATSLPIAAPSSSSPSLFGTSAGTPSFGKPAGAPVSSFSLETGGGAFEAATSKPEIVSSSTQAADSGVQPVAPSIRVNLKDKFGAVDSPQPKPSFGPSTTGFPSTPQAKTTAPSGPGSIVIPTPSQSMGTPSRPFSDVSQSSQIGPTPAGTQKAARVLPGAAKPTPPQAAVSGSFDKAADSKDPIHNGIKEEIAHFQKELDDLKMRTAKACFTVGTAEEMRQLRTDSDNHHEFLVEIQDTTKSLHGDIGCLKTTVLEGLANVENSKEQKERLSDPVYRRLLYKKPLDPRSEGQMQDIRRLHQYVKSEVQGVSDVLDLEWDRFVESKKKQKGYTVSDRETLFNTLANNREIINQQRQRLNQLMESLYRLRLYNCTSQWTSEESSNHSNDEVESLQDTLSKTTIDTTIKPTPKPTPKLSPVKQNQLRNFLTKRKMPPVRSLAPANLSRSSFLNPSYIEDLDDVSSSSSLSEAADSQRRFLEPQQEPVAQNRQETPPPDPSPVRPARHAPISRTVSVQPGFGTPAPQFGKVPPGSGPITSTPAVSVPTMRAIPPGADSTMLATKTVKHGAPTIPATQAAAAAAMRRQQITSLVTGAALTESTLQTVPKVVNVKELKGNGPGPNVMLVMAPTAPQTSVQANNQALSKVAAVQAKQVPLPGTLKAAPAPSSTPQPGPVMAPSKGTGPAAPPPSSMAAVAPGNKAFQFSSSSVFSSGPAPAATSAPSATFGSLVPGKDPHQPSGFMVAPGNKAVFAAGSETSAPFLSFMPPSSSSSADPGNAVKSPSAPSPTPVLQAKDTTQPANFMSGAGLKQQLVSPPDLSASILSVMPPSSAPADSSTSSKPAPAQVPSSVSAPSVLSPAGETLGSFSGLRVGQVEDASKAATLALQVKAQGGSSVVPSTKPGDSASTTTTGNASSMLFNAPGLVGMFNPGTTKPSFSFAAPASSAPPASTAPSALQASPAFGFLPAITSTQTPTAPIPVSSAAPSLFGADVRQSAAPEKSVPDSTAPSQLQALLAQPTEGSKEPAPSPAFVSAVSAPSAVASAAPTPAADTKTLTAPISTFPATINLGQNAAAPSTAAVLSPLAPPANTGLPSQTPGLVTTTTTGPPSTQISSGAGSTTTPGSAFVQPSAVSTATAATPVFGQAPAAPSGPLLFGQQSGGSSSTLGPSAPGSAFGSTGFGVTEGSSIFGQPTFSQTGSFWKAAPGSSNNFSFKPSSFGSQPIFGQTPTSTAVVSSSSGGLFGSSTNTSSASTFSFGQQAGSSSTSTAGGGLFGQGSTPGFGQSPSTFVQGTPAFGSASSSATTTTSSSVFGFGQPAGFPPSSSGSVFGQSQNPSSGVFGQPSASSGGSLFGASSTASGGGGFFSGLGGKPSQEAANKNPFGSSGAAFSASGSNNSSSLFGNSGAKSFGFGGGNSTFGDQKASGTFSAGGSVASQGFGFTSPTKTGGFGAAPVFGSPPTFGGSPGFGGAPAFGTAQSFTSPLGSTSGKVFGEGTAAANTGGFGFGSGGGGGSSSGTTFGSLANQNTPSFGALSQQPTGFGGQNSGFGFGSGNSGAAPGTPGGFSFGSTNQQSSSAFGGGWRG
ncbi:nuclear pore complex protein Nup214 isoform 2-T2 [Leptodactylus fuscus]|uniref:nuclear pore complex protein Nup214 isoform X2 n=1 Tax=Leptodactylus fuscus TaxID=238119 RepID=UPI003F4E84E4